MIDTGVALSKVDAYSAAASAEAMDKTESSPQLPPKVLEKLPQLSWRREWTHCPPCWGLFLLSGHGHPKATRHGSEAWCLRSELVDLIVT